MTDRRTDRRTDGHPKPIGPKSFGLGPKQPLGHVLGLKLEGNGARTSESYES